MTPNSAQASDGAKEVVAPLGQPNETKDHRRRLLPSDEAAAGAAVSAARVDTDTDADVEVPHSLSTWRTTMLSEPAREVREAIGGIVLVLTLPLSLQSEISAWPSKHRHADDYLDVVEAVDAVKDLIEEENYGREVPAVVLVMATGKGVGEGDLGPTTNKLEQTIREERGVLSWELVGWDGEVGEDGITTDRPAALRNDFGELMGMERVKELLEAVDWSAHGVDPDEKDPDFGFLSGDEEDGARRVDGIKLQGQELEREMMGLKLAMRDQDLGEGDAEEHRALSTGAEEDEDLKIDQLPGLLERVVAIREAGAEMNKADREKFAKREVERIMKDLT